jgi:hypothetical protein
VIAFGSHRGLDLAVYDGTDWSFETISGEIPVFDSISLVLGPDDHPIVAFIADMNVNVATHDGTEWSIDTLYSGIAGDSCIALGTNGEPTICFITSGLGNDLAVAEFDGSEWQASAAVNYFSSGMGTSLAFGQDGNPVISYSDMAEQPGGGARLARFNGLSWATEVVEDNSVSDWNGFYSSLSFGPDGEPTLSYDAYDEGLKLARFDGDAWSVENLDSNSGLSSLAFGPDGETAISYWRYDHDNDDVNNLMFAWWF